MARFDDRVVVQPVGCFSSPPRRQQVPEPARCFVGTRHLQDPPLVEEVADDLQAHRPAAPGDTSGDGTMAQR